MQTTQSLREQLAETERAGRAKRDPARQVVFDRAQKELAESGLRAGALQVGAQAPDFALPNHRGEVVELRRLLARGPVVLSFYRGAWCPYCNLELRALQGVLGDIRGAGAELVAVSPQKPDGSLSAHEKNGLSFDVLSDHDNQLARQFRIVFRLPDELAKIYLANGLDLGERNGTGKFELPIPATYVIDRSGTIRHAHLDIDYTKRLEPSEILGILRKL
ncbi:MAG: AhpC/TSA family protein [Alphaproteobacteria bacterium]|nr:AhpC/TSA family protein [Alphaproteobacteria bacterium]